MQHLIQKYDLSYSANQVQLLWRVCKKASGCPLFVDSRQASRPESRGTLVQARHKASYERKQREEREQAKQQPSVSNDAQSRERRPSNNAPPRPAAKAAAPTPTADFFSAPPRRPSRTAEVGRSGTRGLQSRRDLGCILQLCCLGWQAWTICGP